MNEFDFHETEKIRDWGVIILGVLAVLVCFERADFLALLLVLRAAPFLRKKWNEQQSKFLCYGLLISSLFDFAW
jgi:hypothetical protein